MAKNSGNIIVGKFKRPLDDSEGLPRIEDHLEQYKKRLDKLKAKDLERSSKKKNKD
jgi:hypothetical protein